VGAADGTAFEKAQNTSCINHWLCYIPRSVSPASKAGDILQRFLTQNADNQSVGPEGPPQSKV
jgi:hypothetical protein